MQLKGGKELFEYICPECGARLDPGERCDCRDEREIERKKREEAFKELLIEGKDGQLRMAV